MNSQPVSIELLLVVPNPIFRLGLKSVWQSCPDMVVVAEVETASAALKYLQTQRLSEVTIPPTLAQVIVIDSAIEGSPLPLCQNLKAWYPQYKQVLLADPQISAAIAQQIGIEGYCPKTAAPSQLVATVRQVALGETYQVQIEINQHRETSSPSDRWQVLLHDWYVRGLKTINQAESNLKQQQSYIPQLSRLEQAVVQGRLRELSVARRCVHWLLAPRRQTPEFPASEIAKETEPRVAEELTPALVPVSGRKQAFAATAMHLQFDLENLTQSPLELDILKREKRQELLQGILEELEVLIEDLQFSQIQRVQLVSKKMDLLRDLWTAAIARFFGRYSRLKIENEEIEVVPLLLQEIDKIEQDYLEKIPLFVELLSYLLYETPLMIDHRLYAVGTPEALRRAEMLIQNLVIQIGNGVVNSLLNRLADVVSVKQVFYDQQLISSRKIERFRNDLSWKARQEQWFGEPKAIFESQYCLLVLEGRGIKKVAIYASRREELDRLKGWSLWVTLLLEGRDAIAPRLQALVAALGRVLVYFLTQVVGRGIGLVARGILQGVGNSWSESRLSRNGDRPQ